MQEKMSPEELALVEGQIYEAEKVLEAACLQLKRMRPFYGVMLSSMPIVSASSWLSTMATDGRCIYYSPEFVMGMTDERKKLVLQRLDKNIKDPKKNKEMKEYIECFYTKKTAREIAFVLEHEVDHVVSEHMYRGKGFDPDLYNIAADHRINTTAVRAHARADGGLCTEAWFPQGDSTVFDPMKEFGFLKWGYCDFQYADLYTEQIYEILMKKGAGGFGDKGMQGVDSHANAGGGFGSGQRHSDAEEGEGDLGEGDLSDILGLDPQGQPRLTEEQRKRNDTIMRRSIDNAVQAAGSGAPEDARKFLDEAPKAKINYLRYLRKTIERLFKENVTFRRLSRRSYSLSRTLQATGHISTRQIVGLPSHSKAKTISAWIGFDVSGSFNDGLLKPTIREIKGLCNQYDDFEVSLFCWSTAVGDVKTYTKATVKEMSDYKIRTTFGTDVSCVFKMLDKLKKEPDQVVIYTDGIFSDVSKTKDWAKKYGKKTLWIILGNSQDWKPPFGKAINFDKYVR